MTFSIVFAGQSEPQNIWLYDFFSRGIQSAFAEYSVAVPKKSNATEHYYQAITYSVSYNSTDKTYEFRFLHEHRDDWNSLTHGGSSQPPSQTVYYTGSKIQPWTSANGMGYYSERYERKVPNWLVFESLDSLILIQTKMGNPLPSLTGLFYPDELKSLKKIHKESGSAEGTLQAGFDYDDNGNVVEISRAYLGNFSTRKTTSVKKLDEYTVSIRNKNDEIVFLEVLTAGSKTPLLEGIQFKSGEKKCVIYNFELNRLLHKFVPELVADPDQLLHDFIMSLQEISSKPFARFESTASK